LRQASRRQRDREGEREGGGGRRERREREALAAPIKSACVSWARSRAFSKSFERICTPESSRSLSVICGFFEMALCCWHWVALEK